MSLPITELEFDDAIDRSWSRFRDTLVARVGEISGDQTLAFTRERSGIGQTAADLTFRRLHDGVVCAVMAIDATSDRPGSEHGWSRTGPHHLMRIESTDAIDDIVDAAVEKARTVWGITHPSFLRPSGSSSPPAAGSRSAAMADHPAGGIGRAVRRVVDHLLSGVVEVDHYQALELRYPAGIVHLQVWEVERSALLWTTIRGIDPDNLASAHEVLEPWPGLELVVDGSTVDVELAVDLGDRPSRTMVEALDRWHMFMHNGHGALVDALARPGGGSESEVIAPLQAVLQRHRDGHRVTADDIDQLLRQDRAVLLDSLDVCRRRSVSWMSWADRRRGVGDAEGSAVACTEAQMWDSAFSAVSRALREAVSPTR